MSDTFVEFFLKGETISEENMKRRRAKVAWYGTSDRRNFAIIKELCAENDEGFSRTMWDNERKLWGTLRIENVKNLIESGMWTPIGLPQSKNPVVLRRVKEIINAKNAQVQKKRDLEDQKAAEVVAKRNADAIEKEMHRRKKHDLMFTFSESDANEAWSKYGLRRVVLDATKHFAWLGPSTLEPMTRIHNWFTYPHNLEKGIKRIVEEEFEPAYSKYMNNLSKPSSTATPKRKRPKAQLKASEDSHVQDVINRVNAAKFDPHFLSLQKIAESAKNMKPRAPIYSRACPLCDVKPIEQFMDCGCIDESNKSWLVCWVCHSIYHKTKLSCLCKSI